MKKKNYMCDNGDDVVNSLQDSVFRSMSSGSDVDSIGNPCTINISQTDIKLPTVIAPTHIVKILPYTIFSPYMSRQRAMIMSDLGWWWTYNSTDTPLGRMFFRPVNKLSQFLSRPKGSISRDIKWLINNNWIKTTGLILIDGYNKKWYSLTEKSNSLIIKYLNNNFIPLNKGKSNQNATLCNLMQPNATLCNLMQPDATNTLDLKPDTLNQRAAHFENSESQQLSTGTSALDPTRQGGHEKVTKGDLKEKGYDVLGKRREKDLKLSVEAYNDKQPYRGDPFDALEYFQQQYKKLKGKDYIPTKWDSRDMSALLDNITIDIFKVRVVEYLRSNDEWYQKQGWNTQTFIKNINNISKRSISRADDCLKHLPMPKMTKI